MIMNKKRNFGDPFRCTLPTRAASAATTAATAAKQGLEAGVANPRQDTQGPQSIETIIASRADLRVRL